MIKLVRKRCRDAVSLKLLISVINKNSELVRVSSLSNQNMLSYNIKNMTRLFVGYTMLNLQHALHDLKKIKQIKSGNHTIMNSLIGLGEPWKKVLSMIQDFCLVSDNNPTWNQCGTSSQQSHLYTYNYTYTYSYAYSNFFSKRVQNICNIFALHLHYICKEKNLNFNGIEDAVNEFDYCEFAL